MDVDELDAAILSRACERWLKSARIVGQALDECGISPSDDQVDVAMARIRGLVARDLLVAQGDLNLPRFSEVRLPSAEDVGRDERVGFRS